MLSLHRARAVFIKSRTAQANQIRGLLGEFGIVLPQGISHVARCIPEIVEDADNELPPMFRELLDPLRSHFIELIHLIEALDKQIAAWQKCNEDSKRLELRFFYRLWPCCNDIQYAVGTNWRQSPGLVAVDC